MHVARRVSQEESVNQAHGQLEVLWKSTKSSKWLALKAFGVLLMFFIFFVIFLA